MSRRKWNIKHVNKELAAQISQTYEISPFLALILASRGYTTDGAITSFMQPEADLQDPFLISGMQEAAQRVRRALDEGERIAVYGDYDADGVTATALLSSFFESEGADVITYIPNRETEGYGLHAQAILALKEQGIQLIVTVDNGITALEEALLIAELGMDLVITDHHQPGEVLPQAAAVVDPHCCADLPFCDWAGVGVAFKLACAVFDGDPRSLLETYGDLIAIGTIGDVVPLTGENRLLVKQGLVVLNESKRTGLAAFRQITNNQDRCFSAVEVAFVLVPRINAAGRMDHAGAALELLTTDDYDLAMLRAEQLCEYNTQRQAMEQLVLNDLQIQIEAEPSLLKQRVLVFSGAGYHQGVVGIVASRMAERYGKPCVILSEQADGTAKGSCRSITGFSIYDALQTCSAELLRFGGHPMAAGLSLEITNIEAFRLHINAYAKQLFTAMPVPELNIDCRIAPDYLNLDLLDDLAMLEPYGSENEQPVFGLFQLELKQATPVGGGKHLRLNFQKGGRSYTMMYFGVSQSDFLFTPGQKLDAAVKISRNLWEGRESVSIQICDLKPSALDQERYFAERALYEQYQMGETLEEEQLCTLIPDREASAIVYRYLFRHKDRAISVDSAYLSIFEQPITYGQLAVTLGAFQQMGLVEPAGGGYTLLASAGKVDLEAAPILLDLKSRVSYG